MVENFGIVLRRLRVREGLTHEGPHRHLDRLCMTKKTQLTVALPAENRKVDGSIPSLATESPSQKAAPQTTITGLGGFLVHRSARTQLERLGVERR